MSTKTVLMFGFAALFLMWVADTGDILWLTCSVILVLSVVVSSKIVSNIKRQRGVR